MTAITGSVAEIAHSCSICNQVVVNLDDRTQSHILGQLGELKQQAGAESCALLQQYISVTKAGPETNVELRLGRYRNRKDDMRAIVAREGWNDDDEEQSQQAQYYHVYTPPNDPSNKALPIQPPGLDIGSERAFEKARQWLKTCCNKHSTCPSPKRSPLPTRVIDVSAETLRLIDTRAEGLKHGMYVTLSYCWGGPQPVTTTKATLQQNLRMIPSDELPQTIKDAITVTRALKVKYIWIDAICIVQDDPEDKSLEISRMTDIYNRSYVTISAGTASTCRDGFLQTRQLEKTPIRLRAEFSRKKKGSVLLVIDPDRDEPIHKRGWTMQEHLLAPRLLMFGSLCMEFRCLSGNERDGGTVLPFDVQQHGMPVMEGRVASVLYSAKYGGVPDARRKNVLKLNTFLYRTGLMSLALRITGEQDQQQGILIEQWASIVEAYTQRSLGFLDDRLNAISGIAKKMHRAELGEYLGGIFSYALLPQLMWARAEGQLPLPRPSQGYRAPSWSWTSIDGQVNFKNHMWSTLEVTANLMEFHIQPKSGVEKYTKYISGLIRISGKATILKLMRSPEDSELVVPQSHTNISLILDALEFQNVSSLDVSLLQILNDSGVIRSLVLQGKDDGTFQRIGYCDMPQYGDQTAKLRADWFEKEFSIV
ncbi:heterokaryon incompatibility protein-domain-containing protein [Xylaria bambusicola]|uniref:heterokaryon incompatibility protein-domain-containing protein n=1 Tax=Xylaria bambusicola TaxID=326684 RepID=UPI0020081AF3|nr:heterokaryon incompatibility protein-domain-containing protein [Xylaria bambusicola]KAI0512607.1 heterokaryon incompatibility protein-domain-containing protein [Xylaria bambusicola]